MSKQLNIDLNFRANTGQAEQAVQSLQSTLSQIASKTTFSVGKKISTDLREAGVAAQQLQGHLTNAMNVNTGKLDLNKLNNSLISAKTNLTSLTTSLLKAGSDGQAAFTQLAMAISKASAPTMTLNAQMSQLWVTLKNTAKWQISSSMLHGFIGGIQKAYGYAQDLNESLNDIRIVTGYSIEEMEKFALSANKAAKALSASTLDYTKASLIYFQQGLSMEEAEKRAAVTVKMSNVTSQSAEVVSDQMTAIWNNFYDGSKSLEYYADVLTKLGAATASSTDEIAGGLEKFAGVAETIGLSYEYAASALATITAETRMSEEVVGTALKTIFARVQGLKLGETLEDGVDLNKYSEALQTVGVDILDVNGQMKNMDVILDETAAKWGTLSKAQQMALAQTVAGVRQYTQFVTLMDEWDTMQRNVDLAQNSEGELQNQADIYAESWEGAKARVQASMQAIYSALLDDDFFIDLNNVLSDIIDGIGSFIDGIGGMKGAFGILASFIFTSLSSKINPIINTVKSNFQVMFSSASERANKLGVEMQKIISELQQTSGLNMNIVSETQLTNANQLITAKTKLSQISKNLTETERAQAEMTISLIEKEQAQAEAIAMTIQQLQEKRQSILNNMTSDASQATTSESMMQPIDSRIERLTNAKINAASRGNSSRVVELNNQLQILDKNYEKVSNAAEAAAKVMLNAFKTNLETTNNEVVEGSVVFERYIELLEQYSSKSVSKISATEGLDNARIVLMEYIDSLPQAIKGSGEVAQSINDISRAASQDTMQKGINRLINGLKNAKIPANELKKILRNFGQGKNIDELLKSTDQLNKKEKELLSTQERINAAVKNFNPTHSFTKVEKVTAFGSALTSVAMTFNSLKSMVSSWVDPDISFGEKLMSTFMALGMTIPMVTNSFNSMLKMMGLMNVEQAKLTIQQAGIIAGNYAEVASLKTEEATELRKIANSYIIQELKEEEAKAQLQSILMSKYGRSEKEAEIAAGVIYQQVQAKNVALTNLETAADKGNILAKGMLNLLKLAGISIEEGEMVVKEGSIAATIQQTLANYGLQASMWPLIVIGALIVAAFAAIIAIAYGIVKAFQAIQRNSPEQRMENLEKATENLKTEIEDTKKSVEELTESINNIQSSYDAIEKMTIGQEGYTEAIRKTNEEVLALLEKYPMLNQYLTRADNGLLKISQKGFDKLLAQQSISIGAKQLALSSAQQEKAQIKADEQIVKGYQPTMNSVKELFGDYSAEEVSQMTDAELDDLVKSNSTLRRDIRILTDSTKHMQTYSEDKNEDGQSDYSLEDFDNWEKVLRKTASDILINESQQEIATSQNAIIADTMYQTTGGSLRASELPTTEEIQKKIDKAEKDAIANFRKGDNTGEWNDYDNYKDSDAEMEYIKQVMALYGENTEYYAQQNGDMVFKNADEDKDTEGGGWVHLSREEFEAKLKEAQAKQVLSEEGESYEDTIYNSLKSNSKITDKILNDMSQAEKAAADNVLYSLEQTVGEGAGSRLFRGLTNETDMSTSQVNGMVQAFQEMDWSQGAEAVDDYIARMKELGIVIDEQNIETLEKYAGKFRDNAKLMESATAYAKKLNTSLKDQAAEVGLSEDAMKAYVKQLKESNKYQGMSDEQLKELAIKQKKARTALDNLSESWNDVKKAIEGADVMSADYEENVQKLRDAYKDLFDLDVSEEFLTSAENLNLMEQALKGNQTAFEQLAAAAAQDWLDNLDFSESLINHDTMTLSVNGIKDIISAIESEIDSADFDLSKGLSSGWIDKLNEYVKAGKVTVDEINGYFAKAKGIEFEVTTENMPLDQAVAAGHFSTDNMTTENIVTRTDLETGEEIASYKEVVQSSVVNTGEASADEDGNIPVPILKTKNSNETDNGGTKKTSVVAAPKINVSGGAKARVNNMNNGSGSKGGGSGSKGGGSGSKGGGSKGSSGDSGGSNKPKKPTKANKVKPTEKKEKEEEIERYYEINEVLDDINQELDEIGNRTDEAFGKSKIDLMQKNVVKLKELASAQAQYNSEVAKDLEEDKKKAISFGITFDEEGRIKNYDEIVGSWVDEWNATQTSLDDQEQALENRIATTSDMEDGQAKWSAEDANDEEKERIEEAREAADKLYEDRMKALEQYTETLNLYEQGQIDFEETMRQIREMNLAIIQEETEQRLDILERENSLLEIQNQLLEDNYKKSPELLANIMKINDNDIKNIERWNEQYQKAIDLNNELSDAGRAELIQESYEGVLDMISNLTGRFEDMKQMFSDAIDGWNDDMQFIYDQFDHFIGITESYEEIMGLLGRSTDYTALGNLYSAREAQSREKYLASVGEYDAKLKLIQEERAKLEDPGMTETARAIVEENIKKLTEEVHVAQDTMLQNAVAWGEALKTILHNTLQAAAAELEETLTGSTFDEINQQMEFTQAKQEDYLTNTNQQYETQKMIRTAQLAIEKTENEVARRKLELFKKETQELQNQEKLSKYQLDYQQASYEVLLAEIALQEAQNTKSQVRLQRDSEGNFNYVYTADENKIAEAQQQYEDAVNNRYNISLEAANEFAEKYKSTMEEYLNAVQEVIDDETLSTEQKNEKIEALTQEYYAQLLNYQELYGDASGDLGDRLNEAWTTDMMNNIASAEEFKTNTNTYVGEVQSAFKTFQVKIDELSGYVSGDFVDITEKAGKLAEQMQTTQTEGSTALQKLSQDTAAWANSSEGDLLTILNYWTAIGEAMGLTLSAMSGYSNDVDYMAGFEKSTSMAEARAFMDGRARKYTDDPWYAEEYGTNREALMEDIRDQSEQIITASSVGNALAAANRREVKFEYISPEDQARIKSEYDTTWNMLSNLIANKTGLNMMEFIETYDLTGWIGDLLTVAQNGGVSAEILEKLKYYKENPGAMQHTNREKVWTKFDTGGYTGEFGPEGKFAMLHEKELVLNADDTANLLDTIDVVRGLIDNIEYRALMQSLGNVNAPVVNLTTETLEQDVTIHAEFPNVQDKNEIEEAFNNLINTASQYANRKNR